MKRFWLMIAAPLVVAAFFALLELVVPTQVDVTASNLTNSPLRPTMTSVLPAASPFVSPLSTPTTISGFERPYYGPPTFLPPTPTSTPRPGTKSSIGS